MLTEFVKNYLSGIRWASELEQKQFWQVEGIITKHSNQLFKFDISFLKTYPGDKIGKIVTGESKADKILLETKKDWILIDTQEVLKYVIKHKMKEVHLQELMHKLEWNVTLPK